MKRKSKTSKSNVSFLVLCMIIVLGVAVVYFDVFDIRVKDSAKKNASEFSYQTIESAEQGTQELVSKLKKKLRSQIK